MTQATIITEYLHLRVSTTAASRRENNSGGYLDD